ncbi:MAG: hypothetical protein VZR64_12355, partial [Eubacterium sp.]|nr:hypothetical protein [Eubacterium sp.]
KERNPDMSKRDRYDSDDNRYFYEHYEGKDYYEGYSGINTGKIDLIIYILFVLFLIYIEITK